MEYVLSLFSRGKQCINIIPEKGRVLNRDLYQVLQRGSRAESGQELYSHLIRVGILISSPGTSGTSALS